YWLPNLNFISIGIHEPAEGTIFHLFNFTNDWRAALLYLFERFFQVIHYQIEHEAFFRWIKIFGCPVERAPDRLAVRWHIFWKISNTPIIKFHTQPFCIPVIESFWVW